MNLPLTSEQSAKLIKISGEFQSKQVRDADAGDVRFHQHIKSYLTMLCLAGELQTHNQSGALTQVAYQERKATRLAFAGILSAPPPPRTSLTKSPSSLPFLNFL